MRLFGGGRVLIHLATREMNPRGSAPEDWSGEE